MSQKKKVFLTQIWAAQWSMLEYIDPRIHRKPSTGHESTDVPRYSIPQRLKGGGAGELDMARCILCMGWHHQVCCDDPEELQFGSASWTCPRCRRIVDDISLIFFFFIICPPRDTHQFCVSRCPSRLLRICFCIYSQLLNLQ